jgi:hypothetical protein
MIRRLPGIGVVCCAIAIVAVSGSALAYFSANGAGSASAAVTQLTAPTITAATAATGGTVSLTWKATSAPGPEAVTYYVTRNGGEPDGNCPTAASPETMTTCTDNGLDPGTYEYVVTAEYSTWTKKSAVASAKVTVGPVSKFTVTTTSGTSPSTGAGVNLKVTATDAAGGTVTTFTGSHSLTFAGAANSPEGKAPTVVSAAGGTAIPFGTATALTFTSGVASAASSKNGYLQIYKAGEANVTATEGSLTTPVPLALNVVPTATRFTVAAASTTPTAGTGNALTVKAFDSYGNASTNYTGSHNLVFSGTGTGAETSPSGKAPTVDNSSGSPIAFGTATALTFTAGVATVSEGGNGELFLYKSGAAAIKATEGSLTTPTAASLTVAPATAASLALTASPTSFLTTSSSNLTTTAKDAFGNTATSYTGAKNLTFAGSGEAAEKSPGGNVPTVVNNGGTAVALGTATAITFTSGVAAVGSSKNGVLRLYSDGTASLTVSDGTFTSPALAFTVTAGAPKKIAYSSPTASAGTISSPCLFSCTVTGLGNSGTFSAAIEITDEYGNRASNVGSGKTVTVTLGGTTGSTLSGSPLALPETGPALTSTRFTYTAPTSGNYTSSLSIASTGYTSPTAASLTK